MARFTLNGRPRSFHFMIYGCIQRKFKGTMEILPLSLLLYWIQPSASSSYGLYNELRLLGGACPPRDTCSALYTPDDDHLWGNRTCECGAHCVRRNTCCIDSPYAGLFYVHPPEDETCQKVPTSTFFVRMFSSCSRGGESDPFLVQKCEGSSVDLADPVMSVPVTSRSSKRTYKNYFCALCNGDALDVSIWNIQLQGVVPEDGNDVSDRLAYEGGSWGVVSKDDNDAFRKVKLKFAVPTPLRKIVKRCYPTLVSVCEKKEEGTVLSLKCLAYYAPVKLKVGDSRVKYRNVHCGVCGGASADVDDACVLETHTPKRTKPKLNFALLLDVNGEEGGLVGRREVCEEGQVFDPFFKKCRTLRCVLPNHVLENQKCVKVE